MGIESTKIELDRRFQAFINLPIGLSFYRELANYAAYINNNPPVFNIVKQERAELNKLWQEVNPHQTLDYKQLSRILFARLPFNISENYYFLNTVLKTFENLKDLKSKPDTKSNEYILMRDLAELKQSQVLKTNSFYQLFPDYKAHARKVHNKLVAGLLQAESVTVPALKTSVTVEPKPKAKNLLRFDESGSILWIGGKDVEIGVQSNHQETDEHKVLVHIFVKHKNDIFREFTYKEIANSPLFNDPAFPRSKISWEKYRNAFRQINRKIKDRTGILRFFQYGSKNSGKVYISPNHLQTLGLVPKDLG